jgi:hypothetical protein
VIAIQSVIAGMIVLASAAYATWRLMTPQSRVWLARRLAGIAPHIGGRWLARMQSSAASGAASGCQSCSAASAKRHAANANVNTP